MFNPSDCHMECWRAEYLFINNCCFFTSASTIFVFEDLGVQSVAASLTQIISTSCQTPFHVHPSFFLLNPGNLTGCLNHDRPRGSFHQSPEVLWLHYHKRNVSRCPSWEIIGVCSVSGFYKQLRHLMKLCNLNDQCVSYNSQKSESCSSFQDQTNILFTMY